MCVTRTPFAAVLCVCVDVAAGAPADVPFGSTERITVFAEVPKKVPLALPGKMVMDAFVAYEPEFTIDSVVVAVAPNGGTNAGVLQRSLLVLEPLTVWNISESLHWN